MVLKKFNYLIGSFSLLYNCFICLRNWHPFLCTLCNAAPVYLTPLHGSSLLGNWTFWHRQSWVSLCFWIVHQTNFSNERRESVARWLKSFRGNLESSSMKEDCAGWHSLPCRRFRNARLSWVSQSTLEL